MAITLNETYEEQWGVEVKHRYNVTALVTPHVNIMVSGWRTHLE